MLLRILRHRRAWIFIFFALLQYSVFWLGRYSAELGGMEKVMPKDATFQGNSIFSTYDIFYFSNIPIDTMENTKMSSKQQILSTYLLILIMTRPENSGLSF